MITLSKQYRWEYSLFLFLLLIQQNAFVSLPMLIKGLSHGEMRGVENVYNTVSIGASLAAVAWIVIRERRALVRIARQNLMLLSFMLLIVLSTAWSIHPGITLRRGVGYVLTLTIAALLPLRFSINGMMRVLSACFAVSAVGSLAFALVFPQYGIMHIADLEGFWQGVFSTKELLGSVMAVAIFVEAYNMIRYASERWWRVGLMALYISLLLLSRSVTAAAAATLYLVGALCYLVWRRWHWHGLAAAGMSFAVLLVAFLLVTPQPTTALGMVGKDATLTGRVYLWQEVVKLIGDKPVFGWGYRAMWQPDDRITRAIDSFAGFEAPGAHSAVLEIALGVGWVGVLAMLGNLLLALMRGFQCCRRDFRLLGWFTCMFVAGTMASGVTNEVMGMNQEIDWLVFNALLVACGIALQKDTGASNGLNNSEYALPSSGMHV